MDATTENKSAAAKFLADHDNIVNQLATANITLDDQRKEIEKLDAMIALQREALAQANTERDRYLRYSCELSAQLQFIVAGSARALLIADTVRNAIASSAKDVPAVPGAEVAELEGILHRIGEHNGAAGDGVGLTNAPPSLPGVPPAPPGFTAPAGVMVDQNGHPIAQSVASKSLQLAS